MFLGNLSTATERTARKTASSKQKPKQSAEFDISHSNEYKTFLDDILFPNGMENQTNPDIPILSRLPITDRIDHGSIIYSKDDNSEIPRDIMIQYLKECGNMILYLPNIYEIIADSQNQDIGIHEAAVLYQQDVLEFNYHIERKFGCFMLSQIPITYQHDDEMQRAASSFIYAAMRSYMMAVNVRAKQQARSGVRMISSGEFKRLHILEFFEACNSLNAMEEAKALMIKDFNANRKIPNELVITMQRSMLELIGYQADFAVSKLNILNKIHGQDAEVMTKMQSFAGSAELSCRVAMMDEEQLKEFFDNIPPMMRHYPHLFIASQQQRAMQARMQQQASSSSSSSNSIFSSEENMMKVKALLSRIISAMNSITSSSNISSWTAEEREAFFTKFNSHPVLNIINDDTSSSPSSSSDANSRIMKLLSLSDDDIHDVMMMNMVMLEDMKVQGSISKRIREAQAAMWTAAARAASSSPSTSSSSYDASSSIHKIGSLMASLGSLTNYGRQMDISNDDGHHGGDDHVCSMHPKKAAPNVASGKADRMER